MIALGRRLAFWVVAFLLLCLTGPPMIFLMEIAGFARGEPNVFATQPMGWFFPIVSIEPYILWCLYFFVRDAANRRISNEEHFIIVIVTTIAWVLLSMQTAQTLMEIQDYREPYEPFYVLMLPVIAPWYLLQYGLGNWLLGNATKGRREKFA